MPDQYLPIGKSAEYLGISIDTLRRWEKSGKITSKRLDGKNRYFAVSDLESIKFGKYLDINEAANRLEISSSSLRRLADKGIIPSTREKNGFRKFKVNDLENYISSQTNLAHEAQKIQLESPAPISVQDTEKHHNYYEHLKQIPPAVRAIILTSYDTLTNFTRIWKFSLITLVALVTVIAVISLGLFRS